MMMTISIMNNEPMNAPAKPLVQVNCVNLAKEQIGIERIGNNPLPLTYPQADALLDQAVAGHQASYGQYFQPARHPHWHRPELNSCFFQSGLDQHHVT